MSDFPERLKQIYDSGHRDGIFSKSPEQSNSEFQSELNQLAALGYIRVIDKGLGAAHVELTPKGIEFCKQVTDVFD